MMSLNLAHINYDIYDNKESRVARPQMWQGLRNNNQSIPVPKYGTTNIANQFAYPPVVIENGYAGVRNTFPVGFSNEQPRLVVMQPPATRDAFKQQVQMQKLYEQHQREYGITIPETPVVIDMKERAGHRRHHSQEQNHQNHEHHHHHHHHRRNSTGHHHEAVRTRTKHSHHRKTRSVENLPALQNLNIAGSRSEETIILPPKVINEPRTQIVTEIQPVITRHIEQPEIRHIEKHIYESAAPAQSDTVRLPPIVQEVIHPVVTIEVQEIIHREVPVSQVEVQQQHTVEHVTLPAQITSEVVEQREPPVVVERGVLMSHESRVGFESLAAVMAQNAKTSKMHKASAVALSSPIGSAVA